MGRRAAASLLVGGVALASLRSRGALVTGLMGCDPAHSSAPDRQEVLRQTVSIVMEPALVELGVQTTALAAQTQAFSAAPSPALLTDLRALWRAARSAWTRIEVFSHGPAEDLAITGGAIDAWPANAQKLDALVDASDPVDEASVAILGANLRGFPGLEHLLFDSAASQAEVDARLLTDAKAARRRKLVAAQAGDLSKKCSAVVAAWQGATGYARELAEAGKGSKLFPQQKDAIDKIVTGMLASAELTLVARLVKPLGLDVGGVIAPSLEEAPRSDTSLYWIEQNLVSLQAVYTCSRAGKAGVSLAQDVAAFSAPADKTFRDALEAALVQVRSIQVPMRVALQGDKAPLTALYNAMQAVKRSINTDVASALGASIGFGYSDTD